MKSFGYCLILVFLLTVSGCYSVTSPYLIGEKAAAINPEDWNGKWGPECSSAETLLMEVLDRDRGIIRITWTDEKNVPEAADCYLRTAGDWMFVSAKLQHESDFRPYLIRNEKGKVIILWQPDFDKFKSVVEKGIIPGEVKEREVSVGLLKSEHLALIVSAREGVLFEWSSPMVLIRQKE